MTFQNRGQPPEYAIRGARVIDGLGGGPFEANVAFSGPTITEVGVGVGEHADVQIEAPGLVIAPGFIDVHSHADMLSFLPPGNEDLRRGAVRQGVTTVIVGNCGFSLFPIPAGDHGRLVKEHLATLFGEGPSAFVDLESYAASAQAAGLDVNLAALVGQGTLRAAVVGFEDRKPTQPEIAQMVDLARDALEAGALGISSGLVYPPGSYAQTAELVQLVSAVGPYGGLYVTHMRNETSGAIEALKEAIEIARRAVVPVQVSHLKAAGRANHGNLVCLLEMIEAVAEDGLEIGADSYPYERGSTVLTALLPPWATQGGIRATLERMTDPDIRERIRADFSEPPPVWQNFIEGGSWDDVCLASVPGNRSLEGRTIGELAANRGRDPVDLVCELIVSERGSVTVTVDMMAEDDVTACLSSRRVVVGSDGIPIPGKPHPRWAGSFARMLSKFGRERFGLSLAAAVQKMSAEPARRFGLGGLGVVAVGKRADLVVFDEEHVGDNASYEQPLQRPSGVQHVFIGGHHVVRDGVDSGIRAGRFLARTGT